MLNFRKTTKQINDIFNPSKFIYTADELADPDRLIADARERQRKEARERRLLELLSYLDSNDVHSKVHLYDRQQSPDIRDHYGLQYSAKPATSEESQG